jgi:hypothetical protein
MSQMNHIYPGCNIFQAVFAEHPVFQNGLQDHPQKPVAHPENTNAKPVLNKTLIPQLSKNKPFRADTFYVAYKRGSLATLIEEEETAEDSILLENDLAGKDFTSTIFQPQFPDLPARTKVSSSGDWLFILLILSLFSVGYIRFLYRKVFSHSIRSAFSYQDAFKLYNEQNTMAKRVSFAMSILFFLNFALFLSYLFTWFGGGNEMIPPFTHFLYILGGLLLFILAKMLLFWILGSLFSIRTIISEYLFNGSIYNKLAGIAYLPIVIAVPYIFEPVNYILLYIGAALFLILYLMQLGRGFQIILRNRISLLYAFLYLCMIEIMPFLVLYKLVADAG